MTGFKYIILEENGLECPVLFPPWFEHDRVATKFGCQTVLSAGSVAEDGEGKLYAYGKSTSLNVRSRPEDTEIIRRMLDFSI